MSKRVVTTLVTLTVAAIATTSLMSCVAKNDYDDLFGVTVRPPAEQSPSARVVTTDKPLRVGLVFGGGAARGVMHLGVIKALNEAGIEADVVAGTSVGSIAAVLYVNNPDYAHLEELILEFSDRAITDFIISDQGLLQGKALAEWINDNINYRDLAAMPKPIALVAANVNTHKAVMFTGGNPGEAAQISSSVPGVFVPATYNGDMLIDGGMLSNVPVYAARQLGADIVIAIDVMCGRAPAVESNAVSALGSAFWLQNCVEPKSEVANADVLILPIPSNPSLIDFGDQEVRRRSITDGYNATMAKMPEIKQLLCEHDTSYCG
uniref:patatin-like phospholipase family protein n=1 Tax=Thaumasiovibrio occultus TaxID=1891184 RepID=UPI000B352382|nr:patatin-like phospholipase family protein [Thaumasiovibrio occultus]